MPEGSSLRAADVLVETLLEWDVDTVYGLPGDGINGIIEALRTRRMKFLASREFRTVVDDAFSIPICRAISICDRPLHVQRARRWRYSASPI